MERKAKSTFDVIGGLWHRKMANLRQCFMERDHTYSKTRLGLSGKAEPSVWSLAWANSMLMIDELVQDHAKPGPAEPCVWVAESSGNIHCFIKASCHLLISKATCSDSPNRIISKILHQQFPNIPANFLQEMGTIWRFPGKQTRRAQNNCWPIEPWCGLACPIVGFSRIFRELKPHPQPQGLIPSNPLDSDLDWNLSGEFWMHLWLTSGLFARSSEDTDLLIEGWGMFDSWFAKKHVGEHGMLGNEKGGKGKGRPDLIFFVKSDEAFSVLRLPVCDPSFLSQSDMRIWTTQELWSGLKQRVCVWVPLGCCNRGPEWSGGL